MLNVAAAQLARRFPASLALRWHRPFPLLLVQLSTRGLASGVGGGWRNSCLYKILGVNPGATNKEIKAAYRRLALLHHPDRQPHCAGQKKGQRSHGGGGGGGGRNFAAVSEAFGVLGHPSRRATYDRDHRHPSPPPEHGLAAAATAAAAATDGKEAGADGERQRRWRDEEQRRLNDRLQRMSARGLVDMLAQLAEQAGDLRRRAAAAGGSAGQGWRGDGGGSGGGSGAAAEALRECLEQQATAQSVLQRKRGGASGRRVRRVAGRSVQRMAGHATNTG